MHNAPPPRNDQRLIIHFDYDCFYAAVFEKEDPKLKSLPLAVQQKQIIVTCNYEARRRGLYKLQLVREARKKCPELIILLGEDLTKFRNASKDNYNFLRSYTWSDNIEKLGFDEIFMDVTDLIKYNLDLLHQRDLSSSFFHLDRNDPTVGFSYNAAIITGHTFPKCPDPSLSTLTLLGKAPDDADDLTLRLCLCSHLAQHLRYELEQQKGYTSTVGISTNKLLSKLVGNVNKPRGQTTLIPPYQPNIEGHSNVTDFIDGHDIGKIPGIGFKSAQKIRAYVLERPATFNAGLVYGRTKENVTVKDVRVVDGMGFTLLQQILDGPGVPKDLPQKVWGLVNGVDDVGVGKAKEVPQQISIEDSYIKLDDLSQVTDALKMLSCHLIKRMRLDLMTLADDGETKPLSAEDGDLLQHQVIVPSRQWIARPKSLRLSTRPRPRLNPDGTRSRAFARISKSTGMPSFVFNLTHDIGSLSGRLVEETLLPLFRKLHPNRFGWNLSLVNLCATNMSLIASNNRVGAGRDIGRMFRKQEDIHKYWKVDELNQSVSDVEDGGSSTIVRSGAVETYDKQTQATVVGSEDVLPSTQASMIGEDDRESGEEAENVGEECKTCGAIMPAFAVIAHQRFHAVPQ